MKRKQLTFEKAQEIRALYATGKYKQKEIAEQYDVLTKTVSQICNNEVLTGAPRKKPVPTAEADITYKGMACDTGVLTDTGWKRADQITFTDKLVAVDGTYTKVVSIRMDDPSPLFCLTFSDDVTINTAADHRWLTLEQKTGYRTRWMLKTSKRLGELSIDHHIPTCEAVPGKKWEGKDPYAIGVILGDGSSVPNISSVTVYNKDPYILDYMKENFGWRQYQYGDQVPRVQCMGTAKSEAWKDEVGRGKAHFKFVPPELLLADKESRLAVLQGLMDTDGCAEKEGRMNFASVSTQLSADLRYLVRSLGGRANSHYNDRVSFVKGYKGGPYYKTTVTPCGKFIPFQLPRKIARCKEMMGVNRLVKSVKQIESGPSVCFEINHESHQFIAQDFIVVHDATGIPSCRRLPVKNERSQ